MTEKKLRHLWKLMVAAVAIVAIVVVIVLITGNSVKTSTITVYGTEYTTTQTIDGHEGYVYVYIPVNAETDDVVVEVKNAEDNAKIREFLDSLDTFIPGEHVVALSDSNLHFIIDGIAS